MKDYFESIAQYSAAYKRLERLQRSADALMPVGDQKTGAIAEFYSRIYIRSIRQDVELIFGSPSEHVWDIRVRSQSNPDHLIQVKAVSAHSTTSRVSPIRPGWDELHLFRLDEDFRPVGFWTLLAPDAVWSSSRLGGSKMPWREIPGSGSAAFQNASDHLDGMLKALAVAQS